MMNDRTAETLEQIRDADCETLRAIVGDLTLAMIDVACEDDSRYTVSAAEKLAARSLKRVRTLLEREALKTATPDSKQEISA